MKKKVSTTRAKETTPQDFGNQADSKHISFTPDDKWLELIGNREKVHLVIIEKIIHAKRGGSSGSVLDPSVDIGSALKDSNPQKGDWLNHSQERSY